MQPEGFVGVQTTGVAAWTVLGAGRLLGLPAGFGAAAPPLPEELEQAIGRNE